MANSLLHCKQLFWQIDNTPIIQGVDFNLYKGETVAIVGPNGAGKTSLLKCLAAQYKDISGKVYLNGKDIKQLSSKDIAKRIAMVSQHESPVFNLTVNDIVRMGLIPHKGLFDTDTCEDAVHIANAIEQVDLNEKQVQLFNTLSGGEQQRCLIARAIVQSADILIMDEPTNHLDIYYQHQILQLAKNLQLTLLVTIHDLNLAAEYCDRLVLLNQGKIAATGSPKDVLTESNLKQTFNLNCHIDQNPFTLKPRITFAGSAPSEHGNDH